MKTAHIYSPGYALLAGLLLTASTGARAVDNNLHFYGNLLSKSCTLVVDGANLAEIHFPTVSNRDLIVAGQLLRRSLFDTRKKTGRTLE